jgi:hypothetical protein
MHSFSYTHTHSHSFILIHLHILLHTITRMHSHRTCLTCSRCDDLLAHHLLTCTYSFIHTLIHTHTHLRIIIPTITRMQSRRTCLTCSLAICSWADLVCSLDSIELIRSSCMCVYVCVCVCVYVCICMCVYVCMCASADREIDNEMSMHMDTYARNLTHTHAHM